MSSLEQILRTVPRCRDYATPFGAGRAHDALESADVATSMVGVRDVAYAAARWRVVGDLLAVSVVDRALRRVLDRLERSRRPVVLDNDEREVAVGLALVLQRRPVDETVVRAIFACECDTRWHGVLRPFLSKLERIVAICCSPACEFKGSSAPSLASLFGGKLLGVSK